MSASNRLLPFVGDHIHFDTLFAKAKQAIATYAGQTWTDTGEHDPGVTFLEALSYSVSDLAYRHTLPLVDLLTPADSASRKEGGIFPAAFGPQTALTTSPVTEDDYRRAILDLYDSQSGHFYFRNAQLSRRKQGDGYTYTYDIDTRRFSFVEPLAARSATLDSFELQGDYVLYVEPARHAGAAAKIALEQFLTDHRNLGECVAQVIWAEPEMICPQIDIELDDAAQDFARILADIYTVTKAYVSPSVERDAVIASDIEAASAEQTYRGPALHSGWIRRLPPPVDYAERVSVHLGGLAQALSSIGGIRSIVSLREAAGEGPNHWHWQTSQANRYPQLWGADPVAKLTDAVRLMSAGGQYVTASRTDIEAKLAPAAIHDTVPVVLPYGRVRDVARYHPVSDKIPPCYGLQQWPSAVAQSQTYRFLLPFEQAMSDARRQLAMLPQLLSFDRRGDAVWGAQWPYASASVGDRIHADYAAGLKDHIARRSGDYDQELAIVGYLLEYFGAQRAARMLDTSADEFLKVQQCYLREMAEIGYRRSNIRVDQVSALQKRIAARLGFGSTLFGNPVDLSKLPFYLIEHRALLPVKPAKRYDTASYPANLKLSDDSSALIVTQPDTQPVNEMRRGQLIDVVLQGGLALIADTSTYTLRALIVDQVDPENNSFRIDIKKDNPQLKTYLSQVLKAQGLKKLSWVNCQVWMEDLSYPLRYAGGPATRDRRTLSIPRRYPFPALVRCGDTLIVRAALNSAGEETASFMRVTVETIDVMAGTLTVEIPAGEPRAFPADADVANYSWTPRLTIDRFSFVTSLVMNKALLPRGYDFGTTASWIRKCVQAEVPAHVSVVIHWLADTDQDRTNPMSFQSFAHSYSVWQDAKAVQSTSTYQLLNMLSIGRLPTADTGIGAMTVASPAQRIAVVGSRGDQWNTEAIDAGSLLFVPRTYTPAG